MYRFQDSCNDCVSVLCMIQEKKSPADLMDIFKQTYINTINTCINVSGELILIKMKIFKHPPFFKFLKH